MYTPEPRMRKKKSSRAWLWILLILLLIGGAAVPGYLYLPGLYYQYTGDAVQRVSRRAEQFEGFLAAGKSGEDLNIFIQDTNKMLDILEKSQPARWEVYYYRGLFQFFEYTIRLQYDARSLVKLAGRGYLPSVIEDPDAGNAAILPLAKNSAIQMRKALAIKPDFPHWETAVLVIVCGDLFLTGRTDMNLFDQMMRIHTAEFQPGIAVYADWMKLAVYSMLGRIVEMEAIVSSIQKQESEKTGTRLHLTADQSNLLLAFSALNAKDYLRALQFARLVKFSPDAPVELKVEASRLEGEIFLVQSGPIQARFYFEEALKLSNGSDAFLEERIKSLGLP